MLIINRFLYFFIFMVRLVSVDILSDKNFRIYYVLVFDVSYFVEYGTY